MDVVGIENAVAGGSNWQARRDIEDATPYNPYKCNP
jgi:hypothetical protein